MHRSSDAGAASTRAPTDGQTPASDARLMTPRERDELAGLVRKRERVAKSDAKQRAARLRADAEAQLGHIFGAEDAAWVDITRKADELIRAANNELAQRCRELGIPEQMRPSLHLGWSGRGGSYADRQRRAEIRAMVDRRIAELEATARLEIERTSLETQTALLAGGLETDEARRFLAAMPTAEQLMPALDMTALEVAMPGLTDGRLLGSLSVALAGLASNPALAGPATDQPEGTG